MKPPGSSADGGKTVPAQTLGLSAAHSDPDPRLTASWAERDVDVSALETGPRETIARDHASAPDADELRTLPPLLSKDAAPTTAQLELGEKLGEGGMGIVWKARQPALDRTVAVKGVRPSVADPTRQGALLREARVTGALEHPNVIPVYSLGRDESERPLLVMKRIEGRTWESLLDQATDEERSDPAYLLRHLAILKQVAMAVHFAHSKGIIHRDLKPENVMIGGFGEVYVMDWGIAVSVREGGVRNLPLARDVRAIEGTPVYLSPEMAAANGPEIDERSDVYLLGGLLHHVLTGRPPHAGPSLIVVLGSAFMADPPRFDERVPRGLADLCRKAMAREPADRFGSAAHFVEALDEYALHRESLQLTEEAEQRLETLRAQLDDEARDAEALYATFSAARFAFEHALKSWPDNAAAAAGLERTLLLMIDYELSRDAAPAAKALLAGLRTPDAELSARVDAALVARAQAQARLARLERDADLSIGRGLRGVLAFLITVLFAVTTIACGVLERAGVWEVGPLTFAGITASVASVLLVSAVLQRETLLGHVANSRLTFTALGAFTTYTALWALAAHFELARPTTVAIHALIAVVTWGEGALNLDRSWAPVPISSAFTLIAVLIAPGYAFEWLGTFALLGGAGAALLHRGARGRGSARSGPQAR